MRILFLAMQQYLLSLFTTPKAVGSSQWFVNFIRVWNNQDKDLMDGNSVSEFSLSDASGYTPAVFIEFPDKIDWMQLGNGVQTADDLRIKIHILHMMTDSQDGTMEQNLDALSIAQTIYQQFDEWMPGNFTIDNVSQPIPAGVFNRIGDLQDKNHPSVYHFIQEYSTTWIDSGRNRPIAGTIAGNLTLETDINVGNAP